MSELFHLLASLPDLFIGIAKRPKTTICAILAGGAIAAGVSWLGLSRGSESQVDKPRLPDRRIVKFAKWLWERESADESKGSAK